MVEDSKILFTGKRILAIEKELEDLDTLISSHFFDFFISLFLIFLIIPCTYYSIQLDEFTKYNFFLLFSSFWFGVLIIYILSHIMSSLFFNRKNKKKVIDLRKEKKKSEKDFEKEIIISKNNNTLELTDELTNELTDELTDKILMAKEDSNVTEEINKYIASYIEKRALNMEQRATIKKLNYHIYKEFRLNKINERKKQFDSDNKEIFIKND